MSHPNPTLEPGQLFEGKYKIMRELGRGGFGMVFLGYQESMDRQVALKVLKPSAVAAAPSAKERFHREVKIISKLKHPNTVTIHDFGETQDGGLFMVLEFVEGEELKQILRRDGPQDAFRSARIALQIAKSLSEAHKLGVVHRDLKPANVMLTQFGNERDYVKVLDFGVARLLDPKSNDLTSVGLPEGERELIGTPRYMSPEQVRGEMLTGASDIYGLGLMLYEMVAGEPAVQGETTMALITRQISPEPLSLPAMRQFHPRLQDIIRIATSKRTSERFQTADQMASALEEFVHQVRNETASTSQDGMPASYSNHQWQPPSQQNWNARTPSGNYPHQFGSGVYDQPGQTPSGQFATPFPPPSGHYQAPHPTPGRQPTQQGYAALPQSGPFPNASGQFPLQQPVPAANPSGQFAVQSGQFQRPPTGSFPPATHAPSFHAQVPGDNDFNPTVERSGLDPNIARPQGTFDRNQFPNSDLPPSGLPPLPDDRDPFAVSTSEHSGVVTNKLDLQKNPLEPVERARPRHISQVSYPKLVASIVLAVIGAYIGFICVGALLGTFIHGGLRLLVTALVVPILPAISAAMTTLNSRERVRVAEPFVNRLTSGLFSTAVFCLGAALLCGVLIADRVIPNLFNQPNWFITGADRSQGVGKANAAASKWIGEALAGAAGPIGLYEPSGETRVPTGTRAKPLPRTKPTMPPPTRVGNEQPPPTKPSGGTKKKSKEDYIDW